MAQKAGFPFKAMFFNADGALADPLDGLVPSGTTDLFVLAHGWKNSETDADALYEGILLNVRAAAGADLENGDRKWAAVGVYWPAFRFREDLTLLSDAGTGHADGGAAGKSEDDLSTQVLDGIASLFAKDFGEGAGKMTNLARGAIGGGGKADALVDRVRSLVSDNADDGAKFEHKALLKAPGPDLLSTLRYGGEINVAGAGDAEGLGGANSFEGIRKGLVRLRSGGAAAVARLLNQATYFEMKARAGKVGVGLARELSGLVPNGVRLHLVGHSFGGRLVTAAAASSGSPPIESLSLLQAAYSHNGLGTNVEGQGTVGAFRSIIQDRRVAGPIMITHTRKDKAVGLLYAIASVATGVIASGRGIEALIGGPKDPYGGMGANGAQSMLAGETVSSVATTDKSVVLTRGTVNNVLADAIIADHNDVANASVGALVWATASAI